MKFEDCYIQLTDKDGKHTYCEHRVWDKEKFIESRIAYYSNHKNEDERRSVMLIGADEYRVKTGRKF